MPTNSGIQKVIRYINHLEDAMRLLEQLPNKYYRDQHANDMIYQHREQLNKLADEMEELRTLLPDETQNEK